MAEWLALITGKCGDSSSIPAKVKTFFGRIKSLDTIHCLSFWIKFNFFKFKFLKKSIRLKFVMVIGFYVWLYDKSRWHWGWIMKWLVEFESIDIILLLLIDETESTTFAAIWSLWRLRRYTSLISAFPLFDFSSEFLCVSIFRLFKRDVVFYYAQSLRRSLDQVVTAINSAGFMNV